MYSGDEWYGDTVTSPLMQGYPDTPMRPTERDDQPEPAPDDGEEEEEEEEEGEPAEPDTDRPEDDPDYEGPARGSIL